MTEATSNGGGLLQVDDVYQRFGGIRAVNGATFDVAPQSITALIGPNGAGKTTLFNVVTGFYKGSSGTVRFDGTDVFRKSPNAIANRGMVRTFQITKSLAAMPVIDNMMLAAPDQPGENFLNLFIRPTSVRSREKEVHAEAMELLEVFNLTKLADAYAGTLSGGQRKLLKLARALMAKPKLLLLDEPMAGINPTLGKRLLDHMQRLRREEDVTFLFIEHDMEVVMNHSDKVVVMAEGRVIASGDPENVRSNQKVIDAYLGGAAHETSPSAAKKAKSTAKAVTEKVTEKVRKKVVMAAKKPAAKPAPKTTAESNGAILTTEGLVAGYVPEVDILTDVDVTVREGEIVTVVGPNGAGKSTLIKSIFGLLKPREGKVTLRGEDLTGMAPHSITRRGMSYVPQLDNVFKSLTVDENLEMGALDQKNAKERMSAMYEIFPRLGERRTQTAGTMSGGERQMLAMGRALMPDPQVLLLDEPSAGLAPGFVEAIFQKIEDINKDGVTIVMVEQNARRALAMSDRGYVLDLGTNRFEGKGKDLLDDPKVAELYLGGTARIDAAD